MISVRPVHPEKEYLSIFYSFSGSAIVSAGGYFKITPVIGVSSEAIYAFCAQSQTDSISISVANTFLFYAPVDFYLRLKVNASESVRPVGHLDIIRITDYRWGDGSLENDLTEKS